MVVRRCSSRTAGYRANLCLIWRPAYVMLLPLASNSNGRSRRLCTTINGLLIFQGRSPCRFCWNTSKFGTASDRPSTFRINRTRFAGDGLRTGSFPLHRLTWLSSSVSIRWRGPSYFAKREPRQSANFSFGSSSMTDAGLLLGARDMDCKMTTPARSVINLLKPSITFYFHALSLERFGSRLCAGLAMKGCFSKSSPIFSWTGGLALGG